MCKHNDKVIAPAFFGYLAIAALSVQNVNAAEVQVELRGGAGYSDNITRDPDITLDETIGGVGATVNVSMDETRFDLELSSNLDYLTYADDTFDSDLSGGVNASATFNLLDDRLQWYAIDNFGQRTIDPLAAPTPANREDVNFFSTGPSLQLPFGRRNQIGVEALYSVVNYEFRTQDNDKKEGRVWFGRDIRRDLQFSVNARRVETDFDDESFNSNFDVNDAFFRLTKPVNQGVFGYELDLGYSDLDFGSSESKSGLLLRLEITKFVGNYTSVGLLAGTGYSDAATIFRFNQNTDFGEGGTQNIDGNGVPFRNDYVELSTNYSFQRTNFNTRIGWQGQDYEGRTTRDRDVITASMGINRDLSRSIIAAATLSYANQQFDIPERDDRSLSAALEFGYRIGTTLVFSASVVHSKRSSNVATAEYSENRVLISVAYTPRWDESP